MLNEVTLGNALPDDGVGPIRHPLSWVRDLFTFNMALGLDESTHSWNHKIDRVNPFSSMHSMISSLTT